VRAPGPQRVPELHRDGTPAALVAVHLPGRVLHSYSTYARGIDPVNGNYQFLDLVPQGRDEPAGGDDPQFWVRRHDEYGS
jgi:predicted dithiol-disulfide oxidoreductase (DUF899 family)